MNCDRLARWYRWAEYGAFGRALEKRRFYFLDTLSAPRRVLMLGEGDGRFLQALARRHPGAVIDYVDSSARMLALAQGRTPATAKIRFPTPTRLPILFPAALTIWWSRISFSIASPVRISNFCCAACLQPALRARNGSSRNSTYRPREWRLFGRAPGSGFSIASSAWPQAFAPIVFPIIPPRSDATASPSRIRVSPGQDFSPPNSGVSPDPLN
jgi:Trans-aconitate methyltransferase